MTAEERRASLAEETEDVSREDQIFLFGDGGISEMGSRVESRFKTKIKSRMPTKAYSFMMRHPGAAFPRLFVPINRHTTAAFPFLMTVQRYKEIPT